MSDMIPDNVHWMLDYAVHLPWMNLDVGQLHMMPKGPVNYDNVLLISNAR